MKAKLLDPNFRYTSAAATNIQDTWKRFGWMPKNEMSGVRSVDPSEANAAERRIRETVADLRQRTPLYN